VYHNCTQGNSWDYGLKVSSSSTIQLVSPLTKEQVAIDNGGGGNWGAYHGGDINQIKTIETLAISSSSAHVAGETKSIRNTHAVLVYSNRNKPIHFYFPYLSILNTYRIFTFYACSLLSSTNTSIN